MNTIQTTIVVVYGVVCFLSFIKAFHEVLKKHNPFGETPILFWLGIFVWGDAIVIGMFWILVSLISLLLNSWILFLLLVSVFWVVRSLGETIYWINQQFSPIIRNPSKNLRGFRWFKNDSIWFIYQIIWQCICVIAILTTIFLVLKLTNIWN